MSCLIEIYGNNINKPVQFNSYFIHRTVGSIHIIGVYRLLNFIKFVSKRFTCVEFFCDEGLNVFSYNACFLSIRLDILIRWLKTFKHSN